MRRANVLRNLLVVSLVLLLGASRPGVVSAGVNVWTANGPEGKSVSSLAIDPTTPTILYAGTFNGGVFKITKSDGQACEATPGEVCPAATRIW
jgi:hypothetical protein